ncbi:hypothetical protein FRC00_008901 [Tulasnella sp. 408]|nr:hypothetical protein FRC00_008901 [Tulasnella sp. 408]
MRFISRLLFSWTFFIFLVVQHVAQHVDDVDVEVAQAILPFLPLLLSVAALTYLVQDMILSQPIPDASFQVIASNPVGWAKSGTLVTTGAPITALTPLGVCVMDRPQASPGSGIFGGHLPLAFLASVISFVLIVRFSSCRALARHCPQPSEGFQVSLPRMGTVSESQPTASTCCSYIPSIPSTKKSENAATTATLLQILPSPVLAPPPVEDDPTRSPGSDQNTDQLPPLLGWNFTSSSAFDDEDDDDVFDDDDDDLWWNADDNELIQIKEVSRGVVAFPLPAEHEAEEEEDVVLTSTPATTFGPGIRPLMPTGHLNPNIEFLELGSNEEAIEFSSCGDEKDENTTPTSPPAPIRAPRIRLRVPAEQPRPNIELLQPRPGQNSIPFPSREDYDDADEAQAVRQRRPSTTRALAPSRSLPPIPTVWWSSNVGRAQGPTPLPVCLEEEEEEESLDQHQVPPPTSNPSPDTSTSSSRSAVESPIDASGKPSAMKKVDGERKMATVSFLHFKEVRDLPVTICDWKSRRRFVSEEEEEELAAEHLMLKDLLEPDTEEAEEITWSPLQQSEPQPWPSLLSRDAEPQNHAVVEQASRGTRLRNMLNKMSPLRFGKRLCKKKTGSL